MYLIVLSKRRQIVTNVQSHITLLFLIKRYRAIESIYHKTFTSISNTDSVSNSDQPGISGPLEVIIIVIMTAKNKPFYPAVSVVSIWSQKPCNKYTRIATCWCSPLESPGGASTLKSVNLQLLFLYDVDLQNRG